MAVYFIGHKSGPTKIGFAKDIDARIKDLQTGHPYPLKVRAWIPNGTPALERAYHRLFADLCTHGEWFKHMPPIVAEIGRIHQICGAFASRDMPEDEMVTNAAVFERLRSGNSRHGASRCASRNATRRPSK